MSAKSAPLVARKPMGVRVMVAPGDRPPADSRSLPSTDPRPVSSGGFEAGSTSLNPRREVEILNHCFDDVESFMGRLQQTADAQGVLNQRRSQKKHRKKGKKEDRDENILTMKACPPVEEEFVAIFKKIKYSLSLLDRLSSVIADPDSPELLHHVFIPLDLLVRTTGGPVLGASVMSPALTEGALVLLQTHLTPEEKTLWRSLGPNWTSARPVLASSSQLGGAVPHYRPVFLDGWAPADPEDPRGSWDDPVEAQHRQEACSARRAVEDPPSAVSERPSSGPRQGDDLDGSTLPPEGDRMFSCSYDSVARNSSELSVLQGETLEVLECSQRWWKCRNRFDQVGFVPSNILEPLLVLSQPPQNIPVARSDSKKVALSPPGVQGSCHSGSRPPRCALAPPDAEPGEDRDNGFTEDAERSLSLLTGGSGSTDLPVVPRTTEPLALLDYHSSPHDVQTWLSARGFSPETTACLGVLSGAQLFSLDQEEMRTVSPREGARLYHRVLEHKALLEDVRKATEPEADQRCDPVPHCDVGSSV